MFAVNTQSFVTLEYETIATLEVFLTGITSPALAYTF